MSSLAARVAVFCFLLVLGWLPLAAQSSSYHLEFDDLAPGHQDVFVVNDSEKSIEAFAASQRCWRSDGRVGGGGYASRDILDFSFNGVPSDMRAADGGLARRAVLETGERWRTGLTIFAENGNCQAQINAVLFSDGSFDGEDAAVRGLKAHRDGLAASANYWSDHVCREKPDGSTIDALHTALKQRVADDKAKQRMYFPDNMHGDTSPLFWHYWEGGLQMDRNLELHFPTELSQEKPAEALHKIADEIDEWKKKIDGNLALQKLNVTFPAISESGDRQ
jgi:hypothetical protein